MAQINKTIYTENNNVQLYENSVNISSHLSSELLIEISLDQSYLTEFKNYLPLIRQLCSQSRWQLWVTPQQKLSRQWLQQMQLPINKIVQALHVSKETSISLIENSLSSGNYSSILYWCDEYNIDIKCRLFNAAKQGQTPIFVILTSQTKIPNTALH